VTEAPTHFELRPNPDLPPIASRPRAISTLSSPTDMPKQARAARKPAPPKTRKTHKPPPAPPPASPPTPPASPIDQTTQPQRVTTPVLARVHSKLVDAWHVDNRNPMWYIFDRSYPPRQFKRGTVYSHAQELPTYGPKPWADLTESDEDGKLAPYAPPACT
jgi:hypothetical protein